MRRQVILFSLCILAGILFLIEMKYFDTRDKEYTQKILAEAEEYEKEITPLKTEKSELETERAALVKKRNSAGSNLGSVMILCAEPSRGVLEEIYPKMQSYQYTGLLAISNEYFPGTDDETLLSIGEVNVLLSHGWELVLSADSSTDIQALYTRCKEAGLPTPNAVYFPLSDSTSEQAAMIRHLGLSAEILFTGSDMSSTIKNGMFVIYAHGSYESESRSLLETTVKDSGALALVVSYKDVRGQYVSSNFNAMLQILEDSAYNQKVSVTGVLMARKRIITRDNERQSVVSDCDDRIGEIDARLKEVNTAIANVEKR